MQRLPLRLLGDVRGAGRTHLRRRLPRVVRRDVCPDDGRARVDGAPDLRAVDGEAHGVPDAGADLRPDDREPRAASDAEAHGESVVEADAVADAFPRRRDRRADARADARSHVPPTDGQPDDVLLPDVALFLPGRGLLRRPGRHRAPLRRGLRRRRRRPVERVDPLRLLQGLPDAAADLRADDDAPELRARRDRVAVVDGLGLQRRDLLRGRAVGRRRRRRRRRPAPGRRSRCGTRRRPPARRCRSPRAAPRRGRARPRS
mmetsp:Transcript_11418/g.39296  ORF Transcript_11418/g.39296 Transcript_11418/m.39296 type:complete len:260 (-) Transcript_11418:161-940(-)